MSEDVTQILSAIENGDAAAAEQLLPLVYDELRELAAARLARESPGQTLQPTALVHEAYLRLARPQHSRTDGGAQEFPGRGQFFAAAAESMRRILVDRARARRSGKRSGTRDRVPLTPEVLYSEADPDLLLDLDEALRSLAGADPRKEQIVTLRFFGGLTTEEAASVMGVSRATAERLWTVARAQLFRMLHDGDSTKSQDS